MRKKVVHFSSQHWAQDTRIVFKECKSLLGAGYSVLYICQAGQDVPNIDIEVKMIGTPNRRVFDRIKLLLEILKQLKKNKGDIYHFHDPELIPVGVLLKLFTGKKVIYDVHEDYPKAIMSKYWIPKLLRSSIAFLINLIEKGFSHFFDAVITATDDILKNFKNHSGAVVVKNYPLLESFANIVIKKENTNNYKIIYAGWLAPERGITQIVQAMEFLGDNAKLILCGNFSPESYKKEVMSLKCLEKVEYKGYVDYKKLPEYFAQANVGIVTLHPTLAYINDSLPVKLFEYMSAGVPVIASNFPLWREIVEGNKCGICVDPLNPKEIADAIKYIIENPQEAEKIGKNGRKAVLDKV